MRNSLEVTNSSTKQTQKIRGRAMAIDTYPAEMNDVSDYRGDKCQNHAHAETKSSDGIRARGDFGTADIKDNPRRRIETNIEIGTNAPV